MSEAKHTPGPWRFDGDWTRIPTIFGPDDRQMIATVEKHKHLNGSIGVQERLPERDANARLIAAAPDLLAALQAILHPDNEALVYFVPSDAHAIKLRDDARAAIAKAIGTTP